MSRRPPAVLVAAVGNAMRADDGAGPRTAERLRPLLPPTVRLEIYGDDVMGLIDDCAGCDALVCVDALAPAGAAGRIRRFDASLADLPREAIAPSSHACGLPEALALARVLGCLPKSVIVYGVEAERFDTGGPVTPAVEQALPQLAERIVAEAARLTAMR